MAASFTAMGLICTAPSFEGVQAAYATNASLHQNERLAAFTPEPDGRTDHIDYANVDRLLKNIVLLTGPSLRRRANKPLPAVNTRIVFGHISPIRLEGNKVKFSRMTSAQKKAIAVITEDLVSFGNQLAIPRLSRDAQLAYWLNLHNMLVISEIQKEYPVRVPRSLKIGPDSLPFHEAPLVTIDGVALSLRDIREGIVYKNWSDPRVMYGFFHGDLASPSIRIHAYKSSTVWKDLDKNTRRFVNSLRGVQQRRRERVVRVSPIYKEARRALFPNWPNDLTSHLSKYAGPKVTELLQSRPPIDFERYEDRIADLVGGESTMSGSMISQTNRSQDGFSGIGIPGSPYDRIVGEFSRKNLRLIRNFRLGRVTIEDLNDDKPAPVGNDDG